MVNRGDDSISEIPIWRIKYLPKTLQEVCGREDTKAKLSEIVKQGNFPHLMFVGAEGIGKTTLASLFSKEFLGEHFDANFKVVYANVPLTSEERKQARSEAYISTSKLGSLAGKRITTPAFIQVKIKPFVQLKSLGAPFKILIVKNFEALGSNQQGFRRLMEIYGTNCRMILISSKISGIIDPIISRCQIFLILKADFDSFRGLILEIAGSESLKIDVDVIKLLYQISGGKLADAIDLLQLSSIGGPIIDKNKLYEHSVSSQKDLIRSLLLMCLRGDFAKARDISRKIQTTYKLTSQDMFKRILDELNKLPVSMYNRNKLISLIAEADFRAVDGRDTDIQISTLLAKICHFSEFL